MFCEAAVAGQWEDWAAKPGRTVPKRVTVQVGAGSQGVLRLRPKLQLRPYRLQMSDLVPLGGVWLGEERGLEF